MVFYLIAKFYIHSNYSIFGAPFSLGAPFFMLKQFNMKTALLLSGQLREWKLPYQSLWENFIKDYQPDIFISYHYDTDTEINEDLIKEVWNPKSFSIQKYPPQFYFDLQIAKTHPTSPESNPESSFKMFYGILNANELKSNYEQLNGFKYDRVVRCRFDTEFFNPIKLREHSDMWIPIGGDHRGGYNDTFVYGTSEAIDYYCSAYPKLNDYLNEGAVFHPESLMKYHLDKGPYSIWRTDIPMRLRNIKLDEIDYRQK